MPMLAGGLCAQERDIDSLRMRLDEIDTRLAGLASFSLQTSVGPIGWRSSDHHDADHTEWVRIDLGAEQEIDLIALVPALARGGYNAYEADAFPLRFQIIAGTEHDVEGKVIASFSEQDGVMPRIAPLCIPCPGTRASWVKLEATRLGQRLWDGLYVLQLAEMMVFSGQENIALGCPLKTSSDDDYNQGARQTPFLVDGALPYLMHSPGKKTTAYFTRLEADTIATFTVDLGGVFPVNRLRMHSMDVSDTVPQANRANFAFPQHLILEGALQPDFADARVLCEYVQKSMYDVSSIVQRRFAEFPCRYLRFSVPAADFVDSAEIDTRVDLLGFAELEVFAGGRNVLLGRELSADFDDSKAHNTPAFLTDGANVYGSIIDTRDWIEQLALRHDLETERPQVQASLDGLYATQEEHFTMLKNLSFLIGGALVIVILLSHIIRLRQMSRLRQRLAADLHDQVGANLHAIGLLSDIAREEATMLATTGEQTSLLGAVGEIRDTTERTAASVRHCSDTLEPHSLHADFEQDMRRIAHRMMEGYDYTITVSDKEQMARLKPLRCADLFLFYKECLVNISRHAHASCFDAMIEAKQGKIRLTITDNGSGMPAGMIPPSIKRRAKILRGKLSIESPVADTGQGTRIILVIPIRSWLRFF